MPSLPINLLICVSSLFSPFQRCYTGNSVGEAREADELETPMLCAAKLLQDRSIRLFSHCNSQNKHPLSIGGYGICYFSHRTYLNTNPRPHLDHTLCLVRSEVADTESDHGIHCSTLVDIEVSSPDCTPLHHSNHLVANTFRRNV